MMDVVFRLWIPVLLELPVNWNLTRAFSPSRGWAIGLAVAALLGSTPTTAQETFKVGMVLVGPMQDGGWSQAHVEGSEYVKAKLPGLQFDYLDKVNPADRPNVRASQVADDMIARGAKVIIFTSDDHKDDAIETARKHPEIAVIHASGDMAWKEGKNYIDLPNLANIMPQMEAMRMVAGCAAALGSETGKIGLLGPLINDETRRYAAAAYLGAKYCWETYRDRPEELQFRVTWIGFWFNIPGVTLDPSKVADDFYNSGFDVVMSGLDTPEAAVQGKRAAEAGKRVRYTHYGLASGCNFAPEICLGVSYYNWGPGYKQLIEAARAGTFESQFLRPPIDWSDINNPDTSSAGFIMGEALEPEDRAKLEEFIAGLGNGSIQLFKGPLNFQDGTPFLAEGEVASEVDIWYLGQLLQGMEGASN
jgi:simple sugar transport system substrate-binding protein